MKALFIDDNELNRLVMSSTLQAADIVLEEADSGPGGLERIEAKEFDFLLVDLRMPGWTASRLSGAFEHLESRCQEAGANALIYKPVSPEKLFEVVAGLLASRPGISA